MIQQAMVIEMCFYPERSILDRSNQAR